MVFNRFVMISKDDEADDADADEQRTATTALHVLNWYCGFFSRSRMKRSFAKLASAARYFSSIF